MNPAGLNLQNLKYEELSDLVAELGVERYRSGQIYRWVHGRGARSLDEMTDLGKRLRAQLADRVAIAAPEVDLEQVSVDGTRKLRLRLRDARMIETVLIPDAGGELDATDEDDEAGQAFAGARPADWSAKRPKLTQCISSQVGCALDCRFCATAQLGFGRQLDAGEIVGQVYLADRLLAGLPADDPTRRAGAAHLTNLVFMGMGEPLHNYANLIRAITLLTDARGRDLSRRRITVSTAGLVPAIDKLAKEPIQVGLAVSLNATTDAVRDELMPINRKWNIAALLDAVRRFPLERRRRVTFEYVLLGGVNDSLADAARLPRLLHGIAAKVNLIPWNPHPGSPFRRPADDDVRAFQNELRTRGMPVYVRRSRGDDIDAACGQLAARPAGAPVVLGRRTS